ncbi:MAG: sigma-70 family RNA polymerase sigma factor [Pseudomonadales bacterium]
MADSGQTQSEQAADLLARVALRDRAAFRALYDQTSPRLYGVALRMLGNATQAEDVLQDVYLKVWHAAGSYAAPRGDAVAWMVALTRNRAIDVLRGKTPVSATDEQISALESEWRSDATSSPDRLRECLEALEDGQRQSIFAAFFQGLTHSEIAQRFAEPVGTIKSRVRRGLASLKGCLES